MCLMLTCSEASLIRGRRNYHFCMRLMEGMTCTIARPLVSSYCWNVLVYVNYVKITCVSSLGR